MEVRSRSDNLRHSGTPAKRDPGRVAELRSPVTFQAIARFDMGPSGSPVAEGFAQVTPETEYTPDRGFGLADAGSVTAEDRGAEAGDPVPLHRLLDLLAYRPGGRHRAGRPGR